MKQYVIFVCFLAITLGACQKKVDVIISNLASEKTSTKTVEFVKYTILKGAQYSDKSSYTASNYEQLSFAVKFDSSAVYQTINPSNQTDINKLFGFSDNKTQHHEYSARFGWRWSDNALRLFGYIYNNGVMSFKELGVVEIGTQNNCTIKVTKNSYLFSLNGNETIMPRASTTTTAEGYKLYPYFGGDEVAPHTISIWIKEL